MWASGVATSANAGGAGGGWDVGGVGGGGSESPRPCPPACAYYLILAAVTAVKIVGRLAIRADTSDPSRDRGIETFHAGSIIQLNVHHTRTRQTQLIIVDHLSSSEGEAFVALCSETWQTVRLSC